MRPLSGHKNIKRISGVLVTEGWERMTGARKEGKNGKGHPKIGQTKKRHLWTIASKGYEEATLSL